MTSRTINIGAAAGLGLAACASALALAVQPAQAAPTTPTAPAAAAPAAAGCSGSLIDRKVARYGGKPVAELVVYYQAGRNCAQLNHLGATRGVNLRTSVFLAACKETRPARSCSILGRPAAQDGNFRYNAGPVTKEARGHCIHAAGDIYFHGKRHLETTPGASHCR
ncbi:MULTISPECIES: hypothetical protein [Thermomonosporaceae]|uniref:hypothetical protein n=1 Tax=Thermomonosporaceae TaxID=2012 RepID=UPI00255A8542|nr:MULTISPECIES: hypothetical protein [Thermomonosporaceae]MDL4774697.1 hypothetical protein [Actinomadura xylanilytica]